RLKYRKLYKRVVSYDRDELTDAAREALSSFKDATERRRVEDRIARRAGLKPGEVIIDVPLPELLLSEPRIAKTEVPILDGDSARAFSKVSPLGRALQIRQVVDWVVMVAARDAARPRSKRCSARCGPTSRSSGSVVAAATRSRGCTAKASSARSCSPATRTRSICCTSPPRRRSSWVGGSRKVSGPARCRRSVRKPPARRRT